MLKAERNSVHWDHFWQSGEAACCDGRVHPEHADRIASVWRDVFDAVTSRMLVLDVCTGNGAVLELARASGAAALIQAIGLDSARTRPEAVVTDALSFVRGSADALPFAAASFDIVTSQFGVEYTPVERSVPELLRVMKPGGTAWLVIHAADGVTAATASAQLADLYELLDETAIFGAAAEALERVCSAERAEAIPDAATRSAAERAYKRFYDKLAFLGSTWQSRHAGEVFRTTGELLQQTFQHRQLFPIDTLLAKVEETRASVCFHRDRLQALVDAACDREDMQEVVALANRHGATASTVESIDSGSARLAWLLSFRRGTDSQ